MRTNAFLVPSLLAALVLAGCFGNTAGPDHEQPKVREFTLVIPDSSATTVDLYEKNDGSQMKVAAIPFQALGDTSPATVPGPAIEVNEGDTVIIHVLNNNALEHTFHLHGALGEWEEDGADYLTQFPIMPGEERTYTFKGIKAGSYFYHCHMDGAHHLDLGMYGAFIVKERKPPVNANRDYTLLLDEWDNCHVHGNTDPVTGAEDNGEFANRGSCVERFLQDNLAQNRLVTVANSNVPPQASNATCPYVDQLPPDTPEPARRAIRQALDCEGAHAHGDPPLQQTPRRWWPETGPVYAPVYNTYLINGKAFPDTPVLPVKQGETVRLRFMNLGAQMHSMHLHGHSMRVIERDGYPLDSPYLVDTLGIMPGERYDVVVKMDNPGYWMLQDHAGAGLTNDDQSPGGMMTCVAYDDFHGRDAFQFKRALDCNNEAMKILGEEQHEHD